MNQVFKTLFKTLMIIAVSLTSIILILILLVILFPSVFIEQHGGNIVHTKSAIKITENLLTNYYLDNGHYPTTAQGLKAFLEKPEGEDQWNGPYLNKIPKDAWGRELHYQCPGIYFPKSYDLWSNGKDGKKGGKGLNADIGNWKLKEEPPKHKWYQFIKSYD